ncbi:flagellar assembly protein FliW [uncultured Campylobacter sp.]|uniref:flagellar assembly protein FliW n=1 Tax=uncultured Campylobacter sp. TaxID=218934 RepID=UPI002615F126|nr:flagellar assembly protein FliW [uncultured Campylobacter sp.]
MNLTVKCPILGFEDTKNVEFSKVDDIFSKIQSKDGQEFTFVVIDSQLIRPGYDFDIPLYYQELLALNKSSKRQAFIIVALHEKDVNESRLNFLAPILINWDNNTMAQIILDPKDYPDFSQAEKIENYIKKDEK